MAETEQLADVEALTKRLSEPFDPSEVRFKPAVISGTRALALAYVDARVIQDRLDEVLGVRGWQDDYEVLTDGSVLCRLRLRLGDEWITKTDVGGPSEQPDGGDRMKAAVSDALKRAAVKFGIGRYLYRLPQQWVDYDAKAKRIAQPPALPAWALPQPEERPARPEPRAKKPVDSKPAEPKPAVAGKVEAKSEPASRPAHALPANGAELVKRLQDYEAKLVAQGVCARGALLQHVTQAGVKAGHGAALETWAGPAFTLAAEETRKFEAQARQQKPDRKEVA